MNAPININEYTYDLPEERIALHPSARREDSKLLVFDKGQISHKKFSQIVDILDINTLLVLNDTRVIPARLSFRKPSGAAIEIFLLNPITPSTVALAMTAHSATTWKCTIGNLKRWTAGTILELAFESFVIRAELKDREQGLVTLTWTGSSTFAEVINAIGQTPLPPYLKRDVAESDKERYQTVYAHNDGAVAAPTAGLHLTEGLLDQLRTKGITSASVTLHVGAGTFMPVKTTNAMDHNMHEEQLVIKPELIHQLLAKKKVVPVGTTSMRVLESIYWYGCKLESDPTAAFAINQHDPYGKITELPLEASLGNVLRKIGKEETISGRTSIYVHPGYTFHVCDGLITNFHQPGSTLMLLVAALIGPGWKEVYRSAMDNGYRFLSYGDSSLLLPEND